MTVMAKRKPSPSGGDRHRSSTQIRVPEDYHALLSDLARRNGRPLAWEIRLALARHLQASGITPPPDEQIQALLGPPPGQPE